MEQPSSFTRVPPVTLPATTGVSGLSLALLHNTLTHRLPGAGLPPGRAALCREEGWAASRPGDGGEPAQVLGHSRELTRALSGIAERVGFGTGCRGKAPSQSESAPGHQPLMPCHYTSYGTSFFLGGYLGLGVMSCGMCHPNILFCKLPL